MKVQELDVKQRAISSDQEHTSNAGQMAAHYSLQ